MGIFDALTSAVSGLSAQSFALQNISGNIANASTVGYKSIDTSFEDLIADATTPDRQAAGGVTAYAQQTITTQGTVTSSTIATNMAINGDGFFSVMMPTAVVGNSPVFNGVTDYTRAGDFQVNANGYLVNGAGYYLMGVSVDPQTGNPTGDAPQVLQFQNNFIPAQATTAIQYAANLPAIPETPASSTAVAGTIAADGDLNPSDFASNPLIAGTPAPPYTDSTYTGTASLDTNGAAITTGTALSGTSPASALTSGFQAGDTIAVDGTTITFVSSGAVAADDQLNVTDDVGSLLDMIGTITGVAPTVDSSTGAITLHTGTAQDLSISSSNSAAFTALGLTGTGGAITAPDLSIGSSNSAAFAALGFTGSITVARGGGGTAGTGVVIGNDLTTFDNESISGGAVTVYNSAGTPIDLELRWAQVDSSALGGSNADTWELFYQTDSDATGNETGWVNVGTAFIFNSDGTLQSPTGSSITIPDVAVDGESVGNISLDFGTGALTQYASTTGAATINGITQNGFSAGQLQSVAIDNDGLVVGTFSNGQQIDLAEVTLSHFTGTNYLQALSGGAYAVTEQSGPAILGASGTISGSSLEQSNTDIADEFTKLIVTQEAYSANTKVITTANDMIQALLNVLS